MRPYWLTVENAPEFSVLRLGAGVTAYSDGEAKSIFAEKFGDMLKVTHIEAITTLDELDQDHVRPNMGNHLIRGIWFPQEKR